ncbi:cation:proton antiporter [Streptacidiphilus jiangxiensis]|uniref:Kef-type K+ transport system, membrane component KefB n=1 Tax=Streptacidiphilus jiangxiensis TaxID=235985 RepID=A0A1H7WW09_STRJI|nr:cation:proton antiporter [Streptacidiphilus jiangxiensis]SEM25117.1 Kef-type K+ transport system, membrane component KefB [Streptacidiphilus jiangxiensis]
MDFSTLAVVVVAGMLGPLLALPTRWRIPVVIGELVAGVLLGPTFAGYLHAANPTFAFLADMGFALIMFVAGAHVPVRDQALRGGLAKGALRAVAVAAVGIVPAFALAQGFHTGHTALYAVLLASSSAALILPILDSLHLSGGPDVLALLPQVAVADTVCIVALPLAVDPAHAARAALGAVAVLGSSFVLFLILRQAERRGWHRRVHRLSRERKFALELRISLAIVFALAALATHTHVSIMLAGFSFGLVVAAIGEPRRLARQLFALTEGFLGPLFFVWLGASLDLRQLGSHPSAILLGLLLGAATVLSHASMRLTGQPLAYGVLASAQLGVPVAAATLGTQLHLLHPGESAALLLGALVSIAAATAAGAVAARIGTAPPAPPTTGQPTTGQPTAD